MRYIEPPFSREKTERFIIDAGLGASPLNMWQRTEGVFCYVIFHTQLMQQAWALYDGAAGKAVLKGETYVNTANVL